MTSLLLISAKFDADYFIPGLGLTGQVPDKKSGGFVGAAAGYSLRVVGDRLEVWCPPGTTPTPAAKAELEANGIDPAKALAMVSIPLSRCVLQYAGLTSTVSEDCGESNGAVRVCAPSERLLKAQAAPPAPPPAPAAAAPKSAAPTPRGPSPTPMARRPPGARGPSKPTNIVRDLSDEEAEAHVKGRGHVPLAIEKGTAVGEMEE